VPKRCSKCRKQKPVEAFNKDRHKKDGRCATCRECTTSYQRSHADYFRDYAQKHKGHRAQLVRAAALRRNYGLTLSLFKVMLDEQEGKCAICELPFNSKTRRPVVDHNHEKGGVRGILCDRCNKGLGFFDDNPARLVMARIYIDTHKGERPPPPPFDGEQADRRALKSWRAR
jgi:hypothetical protein